ncbi:MAG: LAGLIDADG family homing endonuclease [Halanaeroarchaeum sp.]
MAQTAEGELVDRFEQFYRNYYREEIGELAQNYPAEQRSLAVDWSDLYQFDPDLADDYLAQPDQLREYAEEALRLYDLPVDVSLGQAHVRIRDLPETTEIREIRSRDVNTLVAVQGIVRKATDVRPKIEEAAFECQRCGTLTHIPQSGGFQEPHECQGCERQGPFQINYDQSTFIDAQKIRVQESPEGLSGGETPQGIDVDIEDDITGEVTPGDHVTVTGVLRIEQQSSNNEKSRMFDVYMDGHSVVLEDEEFESMEITEQDKRDIVELSNEDDIYGTVVDAIAPTIWGYEEIKLAMALQLFSGVTKHLPDESRIRGDLHMLLIGDPGTGKCLSGETTVTLGDGSEIEIRDLVESNLDDPTPVDDGVYDEVDFPVPSMEADGTIRTRSATKVWKREAPTYMYRVRTESGHELDATPTHPLFVRHDGGYEPIRAEQLTEGDEIAISPEVITDGGVRSVSRSDGSSTGSDLSGHIVPDTIVSIDRFESEYDWVYDLEVEGTHNYLSNNIVSHNSQLLQYIRHIAPRSVYTSGKGSSSAGLTAAAVRDDFGDGQQWTLEAGALVLADKGIAAVDELDKMRCVTGDAMVELADGSSVAIGELADRAAETGEIEELDRGRTIRGIAERVRTMTEDEELVDRPICAVHEYEAPDTLVEVSLESGSALVATPDHPFFVTKDGNGRVEKAAAEIDVGDRVYVPSSNGQVLADGGALAERTDVSAGSTSGDRSTADEVSQCRVADVREVPGEGKQVYDLTVEGTHNFVANGMIVHNSEDRSAMHEALEQQSYHPDSEVLLADGRRVEIGEFVDEAMDARPDEVVDGVDCEILPIEDAGVHSIDFETNDVEKVPIDRVSRHEAPDEFVRVTFSNGRSVLVTPEHPMFVEDGGEIGTVDASDIEEGAFVPAPRKLPNSAETVHLAGEDHVGKEKDVTLPDGMSPDLAEILGFLTAEGHSYAGSSHEIGFTNQDGRLLDRMERLMTDVFGMRCNETTNAAGTVTKRWISTKLYRWFESNFPEFMHTAREKRLPAKVLGGSEEEIRRFLVGAFAGDGGVESEAMAFSTASHGLAEDYADALAKIGVASRIHYNSAEDSWKTYVMGDSTERFVEAVVEPADERHEKAMDFVDRSTETPRHHDVLPTSAAREIRSLRRLLGLRLTGQFKPNLDEGFGVQVGTVETQAEILQDRIEEIRADLTDVDSIADVRDGIDWSARQLADRLSRETSSSIHYAERGGYDAERRTDLRDRAVEAVREALEEAEGRLDDLEDRCDLRFYRVTDLETVPNEGEYETDWVYDVTVEPTNTFVSQGVALHNSISISKAGINATLKSRCSLLGAANPKYGRFDQYEPIVEQIELEPALFSRFDLIFTVTDQPDEEEDRRLAEHIVQTNYAGELNTKRTEQASPDVTEEDLAQVTEDVEPAIEPELLRKYIAYAKRNVFPSMTEEAKEAIEDFYVDLRMQGTDEDAPVPVTARKLEALVRLAEASARVRLSDTVDREDAERVIEIVRSQLRDIGVDPETGELDADVIETGTSKSQRDRIKDLKALVEDVEDEYEEGAPIEEVMDRADEIGMDESKVEHEIEQLKQKGELYEPSQGHLRTT